MRVRKFNPLLYEKLKDAQGGGYFRALRASSSYILKKKFLKNSKGKLYLSLFEKGHFCVGGVLNHFCHDSLWLTKKWLNCKND